MGGDDDTGGLPRAGTPRTGVGPAIALDQTLATPARGQLPPGDAAATRAHTPAGDLTEPRVQATFEGYVVLERLGEGGMGIVYAAYDPTLDRKVALKLLRSTSNDGAERAGVQREAQAMAKLSHPNVVSVYQVGIHGAAVFIAMEYVDGMTLSAWLKKEPRRWQDIVSVLVRAGRGLEAAHRADVVHRDFKPDNILIGHNGAVRVSDFGLARVQGAKLSPARPTGAPPDSVAGHSVTGQVLGTPVYMAPEQHSAKRVDARADQFSFCVTLYEALFAQRPFTGNTYIELAENIATGVKRPIPATPRIPRYVRNVLLRGMETDPADRYPSMTALLAELDRSPSSRRNIALACLGIAGIGIGAASLLLTSKQSVSCSESNSSEKLASIWNTSKRDTIAKAFAATRLPYAELARTSVFASIDRRAKDWVTMHRDTCEATHVRGEQSEALLDRRMLCLSHQRAELAAFLDLLATGGADIVQNSVMSARQLTSLDRCADAAALMSGVETPRDPAVRARIEQIQGELKRGHLMLTAARFNDGLTIARTVVERARKIKYVPFEAEALLLQGLIEAQRGEVATAEDLIAQAIEHAEIGRLDQLKASALIDLAYVVGYHAGQHAKADLVLRLARASVTRLGKHPDLEAKLYLNTGSVRFLEGRYAEAIAAHKSALDVHIALYGDEHPDVAHSLDLLAASELRAGEVNQAREHHQRAVEILVRVLGAEHPLTAEALNNLGNDFATTGDYDAAEDHYRKALDIWSRVLGPTHASVAIALTNLGALALTQGDHARAITEFKRALEIERAALGPKHPSVAETLAGLGQAELGAKKPAAAIEPLTEALQIWNAQTRMPVEGQLAKFTLAQALWETGNDRQRALLLAREARSALVDEGPSLQESVDWITAWLSER